jgi:hypothetical protein
MEHQIVSIILIFNIILMILYFIVKINRRSLDSARDAYTEAIAEEEKKVISTEDHIKIESFLSDPSVPSALSQKPTFILEICNTNMLFINKGKLDKNTSGLGVIISSTTHSKSVNFAPLMFLNATKKNAFYIKSNNENYIGIFTPFHIVIFNPDTLQFSRTVEDEVADNAEELSVTSYTRDNETVEHFVVKVLVPFLDPCQFVEKYYPGDFKDYINSKISDN